MKSNCLPSFFFSARGGGTPKRPEAGGRMTWNSVLPILMAKPLWTQWWALLLYALVLFAIGAAVYHYLTSYTRNRREQQRLRETDKLKNEFLTHMTHEFRTPLTMILVQVRRALQNRRPLSLQETESIRQHGEQLRYFIDQLLELSGFQVGTSPSKYFYGDIVAFLQSLTDAFQGYATAGQVDLEFQPAQDHLLINFDREKLSRVMSHLLMYAIKRSPAGSFVSVVIEGEKEQVRIEVQDGGPDIREEELESLFHRFLLPGRDKDGGLLVGLPLVRGLTLEMEGWIDARPGRPKGTVFRLFLPLHKERGQHREPDQAFSFLPVAEPSKEKTIPPGQGKAGSRLLIIEDNAAMRRLIAYPFKNDYRLEFAANGKAGIEKAQQMVPDLIVCDIMMPEMDGYEVCRILKGDDRTSHIPLILLTALGDFESRMKGLECGADAYLPKPFNDRELQVRVEQLLQSRRRLQKVYQGQLAGSPAGEALPETEEAAAEDPFLIHFKEEVERELNNPDFSVPQLCKRLGMSHTQLHRKLKALTGQSAIQLIKSIRLKKAKDLLLHTDASVSEVAFQVGYNDPSYFGRVFAKATGKSPSAFREEGP